MDRSSRNDATVAERAAAIDYGNRQILGELGVLQAVIHDDRPDIR